MKKFSFLLFILVISGVLYPRGTNSLQLIKETFFNVKYNDAKLVNDTIVYLATSDKLLIYNVKFKDKPELITRYDLGYPLGNIYLQGNRAYIAAGPQGLQIYDITDKIAPSLITSLPSNDSTIAAKIYGDSLYMVDLRGGLKVYTLSTLTLVSTLAQTKYVVDVEYKQPNYLFVTLSNEEVSIYQKDNLTKISSIPATAGIFLDVAIKNNVAFVLDFYFGLRVYNVSNINSPDSLVNTYPECIGGVSMTLDGDNLFVIKRNLAISKLKIPKMSITNFTDGIDLFNVANEYAPALKTQVPMKEGNSTYKYSNYLYVTGNLGFNIYQLFNSPIDSLKFTGTIENYGQVTFVLVDGNQMFLATSKAGLLIFDVTDPTNPVLLSKFSNAGGVYSFSKRGNRIYMTSDQSIKVVNVSNPSNPYFEGPGFDYYGLGYKPERISVPSDSVAYVVGGDLPGISTLRIDNLNNITETDRHGYGPLPYASFSDVTSHDSIAYFTNKSIGFYTYRLKNDFTIQIMSNIGDGGLAGISYRNKVFISAGYIGMKIIDVTNPILPFLVNLFYTGGDVKSVKLASNLAFIANGYKGIYVANVQNAFAPFAVDSTEIYGTALHIDTKNQYVYVAGKTAFSIYKSSYLEQSSIVVVSPNGKEKMPAGKTKRVYWDYANIGTVNLEYTTDSGNLWNFITQVPASQKYYDWTIPNLASSNCKFRVSNENFTIQDVSDAEFTIFNTPPPVPQPQLPANNSSVTLLTPDVIWSTSPLADFYQLQVSVDPSFNSMILVDELLIPNSLILLDLNYNYTYYWRVKSYNELGITNWSQVYNFKVQLQKNVNYDNNWNLVSVPVMNSNMAKTYLYPTAISNAFYYNAGLYPADTLVNGKGYWLKFGSAQTVSLIGNKIYSSQVNVKAGWNLIGLYHNDVNTSQISTTPAGILTTPFYGYNLGYFFANTLESGKGYWVKSTQDGIINIPTSLAPPTYAKANESNNPNWIKINITDNEGKSFNVYLTKTKENLDYYDMPPTPPNGIADVRFSTDRMVENYLNNVNNISISSLAYPIKIKVNGANITIKDNINSTLVNETIKDGQQAIINSPIINSISVSTELVNVPVSYSLSQNYPNPFNPSTTIKFSIPEKAKVKLIVYNSIGEKVTELINSELDAGFHQINFNANQLASGVYFYEINTGSFRDIKKMMLLK